MCTTTAPTPGVSIMDGACMSVRCATVMVVHCAGMVHTQCGITVVIHLAGMVLSIVIVVCEKGHGRSVRVRLRDDCA